MSFILICKTEQYKPVFESKAQEEIAKIRDRRELFMMLSGMIFNDKIITTSSVFAQLMKDHCLKLFSKNYLFEAIITENKKEKLIQTSDAQIKIIQKKEKIPDFEKNPNELLNCFQYFDSECFLNLSCSPQGISLAKINQNSEGAKIEINSSYNFKPLQTVGFPKTEFDSSIFSTLKIKTFDSFLIIDSVKPHYILEVLLQNSNQNTLVEVITKKQNNSPFFTSFDGQSQELIYENKDYLKISEGKFLVLINNILFTYNCSLEEVNNIMLKYKSIKYVRFMGSISFTTKSIQNFNKNNKKLNLVVVPETQKEFIEEIKKSFSEKKVITIEEFQSSTENKS